MLDRSIPFYNLIMRCDSYIGCAEALPAGFTFRNYRPGNEKAWAALEYEIGYFDSPA